MGINILNRYKNSEYKKEIHDTLWVMCLQGLNYLVPILVVPYLMVVLGAEKFGYYGFALAVSQWLLLIVDFGFNLSATKRIALVSDSKEKVSLIFSNVVYAKIGLLLLSFLILLSLMIVPQFVIYRKAMLLMFTTVIGNTFFYIFLFQGIGKIRWIAIVNCFSKISVLPMTFVLVKSPADYPIAILLQGIVSIVAAIVSLIIISKNKWVKLLQIKECDIKNELKESWPLFLSVAATSIYTALFVVILGLFASAHEVGQYSAADRLMRAMCYLVLFPILQVFYPKISKLAKENRELAYRLSNKLLRIMVGLMLIVWIILFFGSTTIMELLGKDYEGCENIFYVMAFVPIFVGISGVLGQCHLLALGGLNSKLYFERTYFVAAAIAFIGIFALTPTFHGLGAAIALLITEASVVGFFYKKQLEKV